MKTIPVLFTLIGFIFLSCTKEEEVVSPLHNYPSQVVQVEAPETGSVGETVTITVFFLVNNGCGEFGRLEAANSGNTIIIKLYLHYREGFCTQALETRQVTYTLKPEKADTYLLKFWSGEGQYISKSIVVQ